MKATEAKFIEFLKKSPQFVIPIYQRGFVKLTEPRQDSPENEWSFAITQQAHVISFQSEKARVRRSR